jgi:hypothetical protein
MEFDIQPVAKPIRFATVDAPKSFRQRVAIRIFLKPRRIAFSGIEGHVVVQIGIRLNWQFHAPTVHPY